MRIPNQNHMKTLDQTQSADCRGSSSSFQFRSLFVGAILLASTALASADVTLKGTIGRRTIDDNVIIARNTTCILNGTTITGDVRVLSGARLIMNGAWVDGNLLSYRSRLLDLRNASRVTFNIRGSATRSVLLRAGTQVGGLVQVTGSTAPEGVDSLLIKNSAIEGDVRAYKSTGRLRTIDNTIKGKLKFVENRTGRYVIRKNEVYADLRFMRNTGNASILANAIGGNLVAKGNTPTPTIKRNRVRGDFPIK